MKTKRVTQRTLKQGLLLTAVALLSVNSYASSNIYTAGEGCHVETLEDSYELFFPDGSNVPSHTISRTDETLVGGFGSSTGILICNSETKPTAPYSCPNTGVEPDGATNYRLLMDTVNNTYCAYQYQVDTSESPVRSDIEVIALEDAGISVEDLGHVSTDDYLPGAFPTTSIFKGPYKSIRETELPFPTGDWNLIANGRIYNFSVSLDDSGKPLVKSRMGTVDVIDWNRENGKFEFTRTLELSENKTLRQTFTGYLMSHGSTDEGEADYKWRMAGTYSQDTPALDRSGGGWYATLPRVTINAGTLTKRGFPYNVSGGQSAGVEKHFLGMYSGPGYQFGGLDKMFVGITGNFVGLAGGFKRAPYSMSGGQSAGIEKHFLGMSNSAPEEQFVPGDQFGGVDHEW